ncbi:MAG: hydrogenase 2 operon protein HybA [Alphaproteobacteria bacterium]|nr:hydrogenase 2 operon protein HybA [Alphaproteobacteria bacterium]
MTISRRNFLKAAAGGGAVLATTGVADPALARPNLEMPPKAIGLLYDATLCVGCKACVVACREANDLSPVFSTDEKLWDTPLDISAYTFNVIKMYKDGSGEHKDQLKDGHAFVKRSCLHCVDPSCVSACPVSAMEKNAENGIVSYDADRCIGCRYCVAACPYGVPRFQYDTPKPKIGKCELCRHRLPEGKIAACAEKCPTGATLFGTVEQIKGEIARRRAAKPGEMVAYERQRVGSGDTHEKKAPLYVNHVYGEKELGGTQMMMLSGVPFVALGMPELPERSYSSISETIQHTLYGGLIAPVVALGGLVALAWRASKNHQDEE